MIDPTYIDECSNAIQSIFGCHTRITDVREITNSYRNYTASLTCSEHPSRLFFKLEKSFSFPRTQKFQIKREVVGLQQCAQHDIPVPQLIGFGEEEHSWLLEEFWSGAPLSTLQINPENRNDICLKFSELFEKLCSIQGNLYGDTFDGGVIGKYSDWKQTMASMTRLVFEDCLENGIFGKESGLIKEAILKALEQINDMSPPTFFHCDLFSPNIIGDFDGTGNVYIKGIIDFGMSLYAPLNYIQHMTRRYCDLLPVSQKNQEEWKEEILYRVLRIEPLLMMKLYHYPDFSEAVRQHTETCSTFLHSMLP